MTPLVFWVSDALAGNATYCVKSAYTFEDKPLGSYLTSPAHEQIGARLTLTGPAGAVSKYLSVNASGGVDAGCSDFDFPNGATISWRIDWIGVVNGHTIEVQNSSGVLMGNPRTATTVHANGATEKWLNLDDTPANTLYGLRTYLAAAHALRRQDTGVAASTFRFRVNATCPTGTSNACFEPSTDLLYVGTPTSKWEIAHEIGHRLAWLHNGSVNPVADFTATMDACVPGATDIWRLNSKEYASGALVEGLADFYAATVYNNHGPSYPLDGPCEGSSLPTDWNRNGTFEDTENFPDYAGSCEEGWSVATLPAASVPDFDALEHNIAGTTCITTGQSANRATALDWTRALWDFLNGVDPDGNGVRNSFDTNGDGTLDTTSASVREVFQVFGLADADTWTTSGNGTGGNYPATRWRNATANVGGKNLQALWDEVSGANAGNAGNEDNGVSR